MTSGNVCGRSAGPYTRLTAAVQQRDPAGARLPARRVLLQELDYRWLFEVLRPTDRVGVVHTVPDVRISAGIQKEAYHFRVATGCCQMERRPLRPLTGPAPVDISPVDEQPLHGGDIVSVRHQVQRS